MLIAFVGPDGCGKTTLIEELAAELASKGPVYLREMNFGVLPRISWFLYLIAGRQPRPRHEPGEYLAGMSRPPHSVFRAAAYIMYYSLDYLLGRWRVRALSRRGIVLFSRYAYDYVYQYAYSRTPYALRRIPDFCVPVPDLIVTICRSAEEIHAQKPELSVEEIRRQQGEIDALLSARKNFFRVDGSRGVQAARDAVLARLRSEDMAL